MSFGRLNCLIEILPSLRFGQIHLAGSDRHGTHAEYIHGDLGLGQLIDFDIARLKNLIQPPKFVLPTNLTRSPYFVDGSRAAYFDGETFYLSDDDYLTSNGGNTFLYASGDGADIIADFTAGDTFKVTKGKISSVTTDDATGQPICHCRQIRLRR